MIKKLSMALIRPIDYFFILLAVSVKLYYNVISIEHNGGNMDYSILKIPTHLFKNSLLLSKKVL